MADVTVKSSFQSTISDTGDTTRYGPTAHNRAMLFTGGTTGDVCVRDTASATGASWSTAPSLASALFGDGTAGAPSIAFASEPTLGFWRSGSLETTHEGRLKIGSTGYLLLNGSAPLYLTSGILHGNAGTGTRVNINADGLPTITTNGGFGVGLDVVTDAVLKVRTRAQTGYATVDCLGLKASGAAGVSFGPAHPASITIVNGIVTACS